MSRKKPDKSVYDGFGDRLKKAIENRNKSEFAKAVDVDMETVRVWCLGQSLPDIRQLLLIKEYLDINIDWLLTGRGNKDASSPAPPDVDIPIVLMPSELRAVYPDLEYIFNSKNPGVKQALSSNIREFKESVIKDEKAAQRDAKIEKLEEDVRELKNRERQDCSGTKEKKRESSIKKKKAM